MKDVNQWMIRFGLLLVTIGLIATVSSYLYWYYYCIHLNWDISLNVIGILMVAGFFGAIILSWGLFFYIKGVHNRYIKPLKQILYPRPGPALGNLLNQNQFRYCQKCKRLIPIESKWCPYCSNRTPDYYGVTLK